MLGDSVDRAQALAVLQELSDVWQEYVLITGVSLLPVSRPDDWQIRMICGLDGISRDRIKPILEKYNLGLKEETGFVVLYSLPKQNHNVPLNSKRLIL